MQKPCIVLRIYILFLEFKSALLGMRLNGFIKNSVCSSVTGFVLLAQLACSQGGGGVAGAPSLLFGGPSGAIWGPASQVCDGPQLGTPLCLGLEATSCPFSAVTAPSIRPRPRHRHTPRGALSLVPGFLQTPHGEPAWGCPLVAGPGSPQHPSGL